MNFVEQSVDRFNANLLAVDDFGAKALYGDVSAIAEQFLGLLGDSKKLVFLKCENTVPCLVDYLALILLGHTVKPLDAKISDRNLATFVEIYLPDVSINYQNGVRRLTQNVQTVANLHKDLSILLSTSGSTGSPKCAKFKASQLGANACAIASFLKIDESDIPLVHLPFSYSFGMSIVHSHIIRGATLELTTKSILESEFWNKLTESRVTSLSGVPFHFEILRRLKIESKSLPELKTLCQAGGKLDRKHVMFFNDLALKKKWDFYVMYGQTEAGPRISYMPTEDLNRYPDSIGKPIPSVEIELRDGSGELVNGVGCEGELIVKSPSVMMGYSEGREDLYKSDEMYGFLATGDMAKRISDSYYVIVGRKKRFVKIQGNRVNLDDVESRLKSVGYDVVSVGWDNKVVVAVESRVDLQRLKEEAKKLFSFPINSLEVCRVASFPRNENGKIQYSRLENKLVDSGIQYRG